MRWDDDVLSTWIPPYDLKEFVQLIPSIFSDGAIYCALTGSGNIWIDLVPICEYYDIDPETVFAKPK